MTVKSATANIRYNQQQKQNVPLPYQYKPQPPQPQPQQRAYIQPKRNRLDIWNVALDLMEICLDVIKAVMIVGGVISMNLLDVTMGAISITLLFGSNTNLFGIPAGYIATAFSMGATAVQLFLWNLLVRRNIGLGDILNWKKLPRDIRIFLPGALILWLVDTAMDTMPLALLVQNSQYEQIPFAYYAMIVCAVILVVLLCGFAEVLTLNMKDLLEVKRP